MQLFVFTPAFFSGYLLHTYLSLESVCELFQSIEQFVRFEFDARRCFAAKGEKGTRKLASNAGLLAIGTHPGAQRVGLRRVETPIDVDVSASATIVSIARSAASRAIRTKAASSSSCALAPAPSCVLVLVATSLEQFLGKARDLGLVFVLVRLRREGEGEGEWRGKKQSEWERPAPKHR